MNSTAGGPELLQHRLAQFAGVMFWCFTTLLVFVVAMYWALPEMRPSRALPINAVAGGGVVVLAICWAIARRSRPLGHGALLAIDAVVIGVIGVALGANVLLAPDRIGNVYSSYIWLSMAVFTRVLIVPGGARRTLVLSAIGVAPSLISSQVIELAEIPRSATMAGGALFGAMIVAIAVVGARIIGGLRREIRAARQLGQYTLGEKLGEGGMGAVYRARHVMLRRPTAIKLMRREQTGADALRRFEREVRATSELTHPNTVEIYDFGRSPDGHFYYAMEYLDGIDLDRLVSEMGPLPTGRVVHILRQVCGALGEAHDAGLIHRDIKPSNIILCQRGGIPDVAKVLDFGLVKDTAAPDETSLDVVTGTPAYLSPEAIEAPETIGPASDIYALGAVAFFLATGEMVFDATSAIDMCFHHVSTAPDPPSSHTAEIETDFDQLVLECLAKSPADRPPTTSALIDRLDALACAGRWTDADARRWWRINEPEPKTSPPPEGSDALVSIDLGRR